MSPSQKTLLRCLLFLVLLVAELSLLSWYAPDARLLIYSLIHLPLLKILTVLAGMGLVTVLLAPKLPVLTLRPWKWRYLIGHALATGILALALKPLWYHTVTQAPWQGAIGWMVLGALFGVTWLNCLVEPQRWWGILRAHWTWVGFGFLVAVATPTLADLAESAWKGYMIKATFAFASRLLQLFFDEVVINVSTQVMGVPDFQIFVHYSCSGYEGIGLITCFLGLYLYLRREDLIFPKAFWILPIGIVASWIANGFRLAGLVAVGAWISPVVAMGAFHSNAGWIAFVFLGLFFIGTLEKVGLFFKDKGVAADLPALPYLAPIIAQLFLTLLLTAFSEGLDLYYPVRILLVGAILWNFREAYRKLGLYAQPGMAACFLGLLVYVLWLYLVPVGESSDPRETLASSIAGIWLIFRLLGSVVVVPLLEELAFRGYLLRRLQNKWFETVPVGTLTASSFLLSSLAFGMLHQAWFAGTIAGLVYAYATTLRGNLNDAVVAHAVTNLCIAVHVVLFDRWDLWV